MESDIHLRGRPVEAAKKLDRKKVVGGMRNLAQSLTKVEGHYVIGPRIANVMKEYLDENPDLKKNL